MTPWRSILSGISWGQYRREESLSGGQILLRSACVIFLPRIFQLPSVALELPGAAFSSSSDLWVSLKAVLLHLPSAVAFNTVLPVVVTPPNQKIIFITAS